MARPLVEELFFCGFPKVTRTYKVMQVLFILPPSDADTFESDLVTFKSDAVDV